MHRQIHKNCYICINKILFSFGHVYGLCAITSVCDHKNNKTTFVVKRNKFWVFFTYLISTFTLITTTLQLLERTKVPDIEKGLIFVSKIATDTMICYLFSINLCMFLWNDNCRLAQIDGVMNLLQNGRYYGVGNILTKENAIKLYKDSIKYLLLMLTLIGFSIVYSICTFAQFNLLYLLHRICITAAILSYFLFMASSSMEMRTYVLMFNECYNKAKMILENNFNYQQIEYINESAVWSITPINTTIVKYENLEESLLKIRKLHLAIQDNLHLYCKFL